MTLLTIALLSGLTSVACADLVRSRHRDELLHLSILSTGALLTALQFAP